MVGKDITAGFRTQLKKRVIFEVVGLVVLITLVYGQWDFVAQGLEAIRSSDVFFLSLAVAVYWVALPITAIGFRLLSDKPIPIITATAAHLAGSGPGRIIPGSLGRAGLMVIYLRKIGISTQKALVMTIASSMFGIAVNSILLVAALISVPAMYGAITDSLSLQSLAGLLLASLLVMAVILWLLGLNALRNTRHKLHTSWRQLRRLLADHPSRLIGLILTSLIILLANMLILQLSAESLGSQFGLRDLFVALSIGVTVGSLLPTPGGIGGVEAGIAVSLHLLGHDLGDATAAALLYRVITYWLPLLPGTIAYFYLREKKLI